MDFKRTVLRDVKSALLVRVLAGHCLWLPLGLKTCGSGVDEKEEDGHSHHQEINRPELDPPDLLPHACFTMGVDEILEAVPVKEKAKDQKNEQSNSAHDVMAKDPHIVGGS